MTHKWIIPCEITSKILLQLLFSVNMKTDRIITDFKGADSWVNHRFLEGMKWKTDRLSRNDATFPIFCRCVKIDSSSSMFLTGHLCPQHEKWRARRCHPVSEGGPWWGGSAHPDRGSGEDPSLQEQDWGRGRPETAPAVPGGIRGAARTHEAPSAGRVRDVPAACGGHTAVHGGPAHTTRGLHVPWSGGDAARVRREAALLQSGASPVWTGETAGVGGAQVSPPSGSPGATGKPEEPECILQPGTGETCRAAPYGAGVAYGACGAADAGQNPAGGGIRGQAEQGSRVLWTWAGGHEANAAAHHRELAGLEEDGGGTEEGVSGPGVGASEDPL